MNIIHGNCVEELKKLPDASFDSVFSDPPYPCVKRDYGTMTVDEWMHMMQQIVYETRRLLKPNGSACFLLQPNFEKIGKMRTWLWEFMVWAGKEWNIVQDAYAINYVTVPNAFSNAGLMRTATKTCVWLGNPDCYRNQDAVLWSESEGNAIERLWKRANRQESPSGNAVRQQRCAEKALERGGVSPFNFYPYSNTRPRNGHPSTTPLKLTSWWVRYLTPPGGHVLDMFCGSGTTGVAAKEYGCDFTGIEKEERYYKLSKETLCTK